MKASKKFGTFDMITDMIDRENIMDVHKLIKAELWDLIDSFGTQNKVVVQGDTVNITNQYHNVTYPIRTEQDLDPWDRIVDIEYGRYQRRYDLVFCYNERRREHFFIDPAGLKNHKSKLEKLLYRGQ
jgi:hypothetical protein